MEERIEAGAAGNASAGKFINEAALAGGRYTAVCRDKDGKVKWEDDFENLVTTLGKNLLLDTTLAGSAYTKVGPYLGLANSGVASATAADTLASKTGWLEVGFANAPAYSPDTTTNPRKTISFSAAASGSKASTGTYTFTFSSGGTVGGCFLVTSTGALATIDNTAGTLYSVGAFTGGSKTVAASDTLTVTYTASA